MSVELTYQDVAEHNTKSDLYMVIGDKIYDVSKFCDEHPGGEEVLLDVAGQDATEAFEDVGHSDEARELLEPMEIGVLKRQPGDPKPKAHPVSQSPDTNEGPGGFGVGMYAALLIGGGAAYFAYQYAVEAGLV